MDCCTLEENEKNKPIYLHRKEMETFRKEASKKGAKNKVLTQNQLFQCKQDAKPMPH